MQNRYRTAGICLLTAMLIGGAFIAGSSARSWQAAANPKEGAATRSYALLKLTPECAPVTTSNTTNMKQIPDRDLVDSVFRLIRIHYVEPITAERETAMARGAAKSMLESLSDPDSRFLDPKEKHLLDDAGAGKFLGIGSVFALKNETNGDMKSIKLIVVTPMPGSPAEAAGLMSGDSITYMDNKWIITHDPFSEPGMTKMLKAARNKEIDEYTYQKAYEAAVKKLKDGLPIADVLDKLGSKNSGEVTLRVERPGVPKPIDLKITCGTTEIKPMVTKNLKDGIDYVRISQFNKEAVKDFASEMDHAKTQGYKAVILDLRNNPGGLLQSAADTIAKITGGGTAAVVKEKSGQRSIKLPKSHALGMPITVLINGGTASVAELTAGSLQETGAVLVGTKTFGDSMLQTPLILKDGSAAVVTTGKMLTAKGFDFEGKGIKPDKEIKQSRPNADNQLEEARHILLAKLGKA